MYISSDGRTVAGTRTTSPPPLSWVGGRRRVPPRGGERVGGGSYSISRLFRTGSTDNGSPVGAARPHRGNVGRSVRCQTAAEEETIPSEAICHELYVLCARGDLVCFRRSWAQKQKQKQNSMVPLEPRGRTVEMLVDLQDVKRWRKRRIILT